MEVYSFAAVGPLNRIANEVRERLNSLTNIKVSVERQLAEPFSFLFCSLEPTAGNVVAEDLALAARYSLASAMAEAIMSEGEEWYVRRVVGQQYRHFEPDERIRICSEALPLIYGPSSTPQNDARQHWRAVITDEVNRYLGDHEHLNLRGFLLFRLKAFCEAIENALERAADQFLMDREYREFIRLLRYFVDVQDPREDEVHVVMQNNGSFRLFNGERVPIDCHYLGGWAVDLVEEDSEYGDLLISALITISPKHVIVHRGGGLEVINTVNSVFEGRTEQCPGCELCGQGDDAGLGRPKLDGKGQTFRHR